MMPGSLSSKSLLLSLLLLCNTAYAQLQAEGHTNEYKAEIEVRDSYISGVAVLSCSNDTVTGCIFNEFGVSVISFRYHRVRQKVRILDIQKRLDRWYIRRVLRKDILNLMKEMEGGRNEYYDSKYRIKLKFTPLQGTDDAKG